MSPFQFSALILIPALLSSIAASAESRADSAFPVCDLVIAEASLGGVSAALQALRLGARVCMTSMTDWVGGQLTVQGVPIDEPSQWSSADREFLQLHGRAEGDHWVIAPQGFVSAGVSSGHPHLEEVQRTMAPLLEKVRGKGAGCWVSSHCFPASEGNRALRELLAPYEASGQLHLFLETVPKRVWMQGSSIASVEFVRRRATGVPPAPYAVRLSTEIEDWYSEANSPRYSKELLRLTAPVFIDGTEMGDLIVLSGARYRLGFEGTASEPPEPECVMGFDFPLALEARRPLPGELDDLGPIGSPPGGLDFDISQGGQFKFWIDDTGGSAPWAAVFEYRRVSQSPAVTAMNWDRGNDYSARSLVVPADQLGAQMQDWKGGIRVDVLEEAERRALSFALWLNTQPLVQWQGRGVTPIRDLA